MKMFRVLLCVAGSVLLPALNSTATPYASAITNLSGNGTAGGTISYRLNEAATNVYVLYYPGAVSNSLGVNGLNGAAVGQQTFSLVYNSVTYSSYAIYVYNVGTGTPHQISPNPGATSPNSPLVDFYGPRGVGVNRNPSSPYFGTIYVCNGSAGTDIGRTSQRGVYALNADFTDAFGYGATAYPTVGTGAGQIEFGGSGTYGPYHAFVGPDDMVYVNDANSSTSLGTTIGGGVWMLPPNIATATDLFPYNGSTASSVGQYFAVEGTANVTGSYAAGTMTLYTCEFNRAPEQAIWQYQFYTTPGTPVSLPWPVSQAPNPVNVSGSCAEIYVSNPFATYNLAPYSQVNAGNIASVDGVQSDFFIGPDGKMWGVQYRASAVAGQPGLFVYDSMANGSCLLWDSMDQNGGSVDPLSEVISVSVSDDTNFCVLGAYSGLATGGSAANPGTFEVMPLTFTNENGVTGLPNLASLQNIKFSSSTELIRGVCFDKADNIYGVSGSVTDSMRCYTLGLTTLTVTSNDYTGANGSFSLTVPPTIAASVTTATPLISQANAYGNPTSGSYVITIPAAQGSPVAVYFTMSGTATNASTYTLSGTGLTLSAQGDSIIIPGGQTSATITITPSASIASAATLGATMTLVGSAAVTPTVPASASIAIANTGPQKWAITGVVAPSMYRGISNDFCTVMLTRYGDTNNGPSGPYAAYTIPANAFTYGGAAQAGVDYAASGPVTVTPGDQTEVVTVSDPVYTGQYVGNEAITVALNANVPGSIQTGSQTATLTLIDNANPPETLLWSDPLTNALDSVNWTLTFANTNLSVTTVPPVMIPNYPNYTAANPDPNAPGSGTGLDDFDVEFGYNLSSDGVGLSPVMIAKGWTNALKMTVNKIQNYVAIGTTGGGCSAGVNLYPQGMKFSGNYALRFSMNLSEGITYTTEYNTFGINCYGTNCNWFADDYGYGSGTTNCDGLWYWIDADTDGAGTTVSIVQVTNVPLPNTGWGGIASNVNALNLTNIFKSPVPYNAYPAGAPADGQGSPANTWSDVEVKQFNGVVTLSINKTPLISYTNASIYTSGDIFLGYDDPYASVGNVANPGVNPGAMVYYSNVRVVSLAGPTITSVGLSGANLVIKFTSPDTDAVPGSFAVMSSAALNTGFAATSATITQTAGVFTAVTPYSSTGSKFLVLKQTNLVQ